MRHCFSLSGIISFARSGQFLIDSGRLVFVDEEQEGMEGVVITVLLTFDQLIAAGENGNTGAWYVVVGKREQRCSDELGR